MKNTSQKRMTEQVDWNRISEIYSPLHVRYPQGELIYQAGTYAAGSYLIADGLVSDQCTSSSTPRQLSPLEILGPGNLVGLEVLLDPPSDLHLSCARAVTETNLFFFKRELFLEILGEEDEVRRHCIQGLAKRFYSLKQQPAHSGPPMILARFFGVSNAKALRIITSLPGVLSSETPVNLSPEALHLWLADTSQVL
jgi:CRP-like cAMP-binding protein